MITAIIFGFLTVGLITIIVITKQWQNTDRYGKTILAGTVLVTLFITLTVLFYAGYNAGQRDASQGIQKGSIAKSHWL
jgi:hypothetical protein